MKKTIDFVYVSSDDPRDDHFNSQIGSLNFTGLPCPKKEVVEAIGEEGVMAIDQKIKEMIKWKMSLFGKNSRKVRFPSTIEFFNKSNPDQCITCSPLVAFPDMKNHERHKAKYYCLERFVPNANNYNMELCTYVDSIKDEILKILSDPI